MLLYTWANIHNETSDGLLNVWKRATNMCWGWIMLLSVIQKQASMGCMVVSVRMFILTVVGPYLHLVPWAYHGNIAVRCILRGGMIVAHIQIGRNAERKWQAKMERIWHKVPSVSSEWLTLWVRMQWEGTESSELHRPEHACAGAWRVFLLGILETIRFRLGDSLIPATNQRI